MQIVSRIFFCPALEFEFLKIAEVTNHGWWEGSRSNYKKEQQNPLKYCSNLNGSY